MKTNGNDPYAKVAADTSDDFWTEVENVLALTKPLFLMVKYSDGEGPKMGEVYERMDSMLAEISEVMNKPTYPHKEDFDEVDKIIQARWGKMNIPLHCWAFALCAKFYDIEYLKTPAPGGIPRKAPNQDRAFRKIADGDVERKKLQEEFTAFHMKKGMFGFKEIQTDAVTMSPIDWWSNYGAETPNLSEVALKVLSQPISSSSAERNWSTYSYIHNVKRNQLNCKTADKLVDIHSNIRLQARFSQSYHTGPTSKWDADPEDTCLEESRIKLEQLRWKDLEDAGKQANKIS